MLQYALDYDKSETVIAVIDNVVTPLVVLNRKLLTSELYYHMVEAFKQIYSFQTVSNMIEAQWKRVLQLHLQMVRFTHIIVIVKDIFHIIPFFFAVNVTCRKRYLNYLHHRRLLITF